ncbi:MAG: TerB family tellurite resistance protein [Bacteroidales bacterium]|nr:TerB family tellurite resistance protein [Bacteroidales bacterium]MDD3666645.1 TerB family tellurite resistance protein [Bacteroidales bacterium]
MDWLITFILMGLMVTAIGSLLVKKNMDKRRKKTQYGKWIGAGLGAVLGGPIGGILGFIFGSMVDGMQSGEYAYQGQLNSAPGQASGHDATRPGDFGVSLVVLSAAVMKADGTVMKSELDYVKNFFTRQFGAEAAERYILLLRDVLKQELNLQGVSEQIKGFMEYSTRLQLLHYLFGIAGADGRYDDTEVTLIQSISRWMGISFADFNSVKAMFVKDQASAYKILGISPDATDEEVKKAYRQMAILHHPDKVSHLGEDVQHAAKEKFQQIQSAYEEIKKQRGFK